MNYIKIYDLSGELQYTFSSNKNDENAYGYIRSANCYFASDDFGAEMPSGTCDFELYTQNEFSVAKDYVAEVYIKNTELLGSFLVRTFDHPNPFIYNISGIDAIGKLEEVQDYGAYFEENTLDEILNAFMKKNNGIEYFVDESIKGDKITASYHSQGTLRDVFQKMSFGYGYRFSSLATKGIKVLPRITEQKIIHVYNKDDLFENPEVSQREQEVGVVNLIHTSVNFAENTIGNYKYIRGYIPINEGKETTITPYMENLILNDKYYSNYTYDGHFAINDYSNNTNVKVFVPPESLGINLGDSKFSYNYSGYSVDLNGCITYQINTEKLEETDDETPGAYCRYPLDGENKYSHALISIAWLESEGEDNEYYPGTVVFDETGNVSDVYTPFVNDSTLPRIKNYYNRKRTITYKTRYTGEQLGEIVYLPEIWGEQEYAIIKSIDFSLSSSRVFCDIVVETLSDVETSYITKRGLYGTFNYGEEKYGYNIQYKEV